MSLIRVLLVASEGAPFAKVGGLADVIGSLPSVLNQNSCDARVILPLYKSIKRDYFERLSFVGWKMVKMGWRSLYAGLYMMEYQDVTYYFVDNEYYFNFDQIYVEYKFDMERFCFFQRAVLDFVGEFMSFEPDILHCNDWQTGMIPLLLDAHFKVNQIHENMKTVFTIHNLKYQGVHGIEEIKDFLDLPDAYISDELSVKDGAVNFMKAGIVYANTVTTVSPTYAYEIMTDYYGEGLNGLLQSYAFKVKGILNGLNMNEYDPANDDFLHKKYDTKNFMSGKMENKRFVQEALQLSVNHDAPLCVMVSRLVDQKGLDLLLHVLDEMLFDGMQVVVLGTGDIYYESALREIEGENPGKMCAYLSYDNKMAHLLYAAADIFLMPSLFEPCGLSQMIAMRYGTLPIVRETGGLKDTVIPYNEHDSTGTGFTFSNINAHEFLFITKYACDVYRNHRESWNEIAKRAMNGDYSWDTSAKEYAGLFSLITNISVEMPKSEKTPQKANSTRKGSTAKKPSSTGKTTAKKPSSTKKVTAEKKVTSPKAVKPTAKKTIEK